MAAVEGPLRREGKLDALDNGVDIEIRDYATTMKFLEKPESIWPEIYDFDPDIIFWDGFGAFQQIELMEYVGDMSGGKKSTEQRESGLQLEQRDWGLVKQATIRMLDRFCSLHNPKTGKVWHKILTAHEAIKSVSNGDASVLTETKEPLLSGAGGVLSKGAFDLILKTSVRKAKSGEEGDSGGRVFEYVTAGHQNLAAKNRGFDLPPVVPGDGGALSSSLSRVTERITLPCPSSAVSLLGSSDAIVAARSRHARPFFGTSIRLSSANSATGCGDLRSQYLMSSATATILRQQQTV